MARVSDRYNPEKIRERADQLMLHQQQTRFVEYVHKWAPLLGLEQWDIQAIAHDGEYVVAGQLSAASTASTTGSWEYEFATVQVNVQKYAQLNDIQAEELVVHELLHVVLFETGSTCVISGPPSGSATFASAHNERVVTRLAKAMMRANGLETQEIQGRKWPAEHAKDLRSRERDRSKPGA